jgi:hypothetical protein
VCELLQREVDGMSQTGLLSTVQSARELGGGWSFFEH